MTSDSAMAHHREVSVPNAPAATKNSTLSIMFLARELTIPPVALSTDCISAEPVYTRDMTGRKAEKK